MLTCQIQFISSTAPFSASTPALIEVLFGNCGRNGGGKDMRYLERSNRDLGFQGTV